MPQANVNAQTAVLRRGAQPATVRVERPGVRGSGIGELRQWAHAAPAAAHSEGFFVSVAMPAVGLTPPSWKATPQSMPTRPVRPPTGP